MILIRFGKCICQFGKWSHSCGYFFTWDRMYHRHEWAPFCKVNKRYKTWFGFWKKTVNGFTGTVKVSTKAL
jgi:hypothetical protein